jgi:hypothetical protein
MMARPNADSEVNPSLARRRMLNAPEQPETASEIAVVKDGPGRDRAASTANEPIGIEPLRPLATGPIGGRSPSNGYRGRG